MTLAVPLAFARVTLGLVACGGTGQMAPAAAVVRSDAKPQLEAAQRRVRESLGHPVDVRIDPRIFQGDEKIQSFFVVATLEALDAHYDELTRRKPGNSSATYELDQLFAPEGARAIRIVETRFDDRAPPDPKRVTFDVATGTATRWLRDGSSDVGGVPALVQVATRALLTERFRGRSAGSVNDRELGAYLALVSDEPDLSRRVAELATLYPRLSERYRTWARELLVDCVPEPAFPEKNAPAQRQAWSEWFAKYRSELDESELVRVGNAVFPSSASLEPGAVDDLPGFPTFDYAFSLLQAEATGRGTRESSAFTCAGRSARDCSPALLVYFSSRRSGSRRERLARALVAQRDAALLDFVLTRILSAYDARSYGLAYLESFSGDLALWERALTAAILAGAVSDDEQLATLARKHPERRAAIAAAIRSAASRKR